MDIGRPIPATATIDDPIWMPQLLQLAQNMMHLSARTKIIRRYTGLSEKRINALYDAIKGPDNDSRKQRDRCTRPLRFVVPGQKGAKGGQTFILQSAVFADVFIRMEAAVPEAPNRAWLLLAAFQAYREVIGPAQRALHLPEFSFNAAFDLMVAVGLHPPQEGQTVRYGAQLITCQCPQCKTPKLVMIDAEPEEQPCAVCLIDSHRKRLPTFVNGPIDQGTDDKQAKRAVG